MKKRFSPPKRRPDLPKPLRKDAPRFDSFMKKSFSKGFAKKETFLPKQKRRTQRVSSPKKPAESWGSVALWYAKHLTGPDTYHAKVILPNLLRLVEPRRMETIIEVACGTGFFASALAKEGAMVTGIDVSEELIEIARKNDTHVSFHVGKAEQLDKIETASKDKMLIVLAIQNIERTQDVFAEAARVLKQGGSYHIVMNHPAFRIPKRSAWGYDEKAKKQYRRVDGYLSESRSEIDMHPGMSDSPKTLSFHRPLQYYFKALAKAGFTVDRLEEWISHKESTSGPRAKSENEARKEIPLFLYMRARKN